METIRRTVMNDNPPYNQRDEPEPLLIYDEAAEKLGIPYYKRV